MTGRSLIAQLAINLNNLDDEVLVRRVVNDSDGKFLKSELDAINHVTSLGQIGTVETLRKPERSTVDLLIVRIGELEAALKPFADDGVAISKRWDAKRKRNTLDGQEFTVGDMLRAAELIYPVSRTGVAK